MTMEDRKEENGGAVMVDGDSEEISERRRKQ